MANIIGIDDLRGDILIGVGIGAFLIFMNILGFFSLALPPVLNLFATNVGKFLVIVIIAPIVEEIVFRSLLFTFVQNHVKSLTASALIQGGVFALFHMVAYSGILIESFNLSAVLVVGGAFLSAFLFGTAMAFSVRKTNNLLTSIIPHAMINFWLVRGLLVII